MRFDAGFLALLAAGVAANIPKPAPFRQYCGTPARTVRQEQQVYLDSSSTQVIKDHDPIDVEVYFHVIVSDFNDATVPGAMAQQLAILNDAFKDHAFTFTGGKSWHHTHPEWEYDPNAEWEMKQKYHMGTYADLNVYVLPSINWVDANPPTPEQPCFGYAYQPWYVHKEHAESDDLVMLDGITIRMDTLPGGTNELYPMGKNLVHQVGHWLGLEHTFQHACDGDDIGDTTPEAEPSYECDLNRSTCPGDLPDPVNNYMDYSPDSCKTNFSPFQCIRMYRAWDEFRAEHQWA